MSSKKIPVPPSKKIPAAPRLARGRTRPDAIFPVAPLAAVLPESYAATLQDIKSHLRSARIRAVLAANPILIEAYWHTGRIILARQQEAAWGAGVIDRLAADLQEAFRDMSGLSRRNLFSMRHFAECFPDGPIVQQPVAQLPWGHVIAITQRLKAPAARERVGIIAFAMPLGLSANFSSAFCAFRFTNTSFGNAPQVSRSQRSAVGNLSQPLSRFSASPCSANSPGE